MKESRYLIGFYLTEIQEKGEEALLTILGLSVPSQILMMEYNRLRLRIEDEPKESKNESWQFVCHHFPAKTKEEKIIACKIIHLLGTLFQNL